MAPARGKGEREMFKRDLPMIRCNRTAGSAGMGVGALVLVFALGFVPGACSKSSPTGQEAVGTKTAIPARAAARLYTSEQARCDAVTAEDAAGFLGVQVSTVEAKAEELYPGNIQCSFVSGGSYNTMVSFTITISERIDEAAKEMAQYRSHLEVAGGTKPFKDDLARGAYTDIDHLGDEALWTEANRTLTVRKGNVSLQVQTPHDRNAQIGIAKIFLGRL